MARQPIRTTCGGSRYPFTLPGNETAEVNYCLAVYCTLAPRIYEGGAPVRKLGRGEQFSGKLPQSKLPFMAILPAPS